MKTCVCNRCRRRRPIEKMSAARKGRKARDCKDCFNSYRRTRYHNSKKVRDKARDAERQYHDAYPLRAMIARARKRAAEKSIPFNIVEADLVLP